MLLLWNECSTARQRGPDLQQLRATALRFLPKSELKSTNKRYKMYKETATGVQSHIVMTTVVGRAVLSSSLTHTMGARASGCKAG